jgi:hypothetical protein
MVSCPKLAVDVAKDDGDGAAGGVLDDVVDELVDFGKKGLVIAGLEAALRRHVQDDEGDVLSAPLEAKSPNSTGKGGRGRVDLCHV